MSTGIARQRWTLLVMILAVGLLHGCSDAGAGGADTSLVDVAGIKDMGPAKGTVGGPCYGNGTCNTGLICASGFCVRLADLGPGKDGPKSQDAAQVGDGPVAPSFDASPLPDGRGPLWKCTTPGKLCDSHNKCALVSICGQDKLCHPTMIYSCADGLACTDDNCLGSGQCENKPKAGTCALFTGTGATQQLKCFKQGDKKPGDSCKICSATSPTKWFGANGGACNDNEDCTQNDYCQGGVCKGTYFGQKCADSFSCTEDLCDGKGGCLGNKLKSGWCLINSTCYPKGAKNPSGGCSYCDPTTSSTSWTPC